MFSTIFLFEIKRWFKQPVFYVYVLVFGLIAYFAAISALGAFDTLAGTTSDPIYYNSPINIARFVNSLSTLLYFLLPTIVGASIYRDYLYKVHTVLYSYPLRKLDYLAGKFMASLLVVSLICLVCLIAFYAASLYPTVNPTRVGLHYFKAYLHAFFIVVLPNFLLFGSIIFALVTFTRNVYIGFVFVLILFLLQTVLETALQNIDNRTWVALLDPFGYEPIEYYTRYWSVAQQNTEFLPLSGVLLYNRLIWTTVAFLILVVVYRFFRFSQLGPVFGRRKPAVDPTAADVGMWFLVTRPLVSYSFGFWSQLKRSWRLSHADYRYLIANWTFIILIIIAFLFSLLVISMSDQLFGTTTYPVTWQTVLATSAIYGFFIQIIILLFAGMLVQRSRQSQMHLLLEGTGVPNWVLLSAQAIALFKLLWTMMVVCMITGISYQLYQGYDQIELPHYLFDLFVLGTLKYAYLIFFALFIHSLFRNYFVGFVCALVIVFGLPSLDQLGIEQDMFIPDAAPSYAYSDMNGYGDIRHFIVYRVYWFLFGLLLFGLTLLFWRRGEAVTIKEKFYRAKRRMKPALIVPMAMILLGFLAIGYAIYVETNIRQPYYGKMDRERHRVDYEQKYSSYKDLMAPRLVDVFVKLDLVPEDRTFYADASFTYVNKSGALIDTIFMNVAAGLLTEVEVDRPEQLIEKDSLHAIRISKLEEALQPGDSLTIRYRVRNRPNGFLFDRSPVLSNGTFLSNSIFPVLNYSSGREIGDNEIRRRHGLPDKMRMPDPADSASWANNYISQDADWIDFQTIISTAVDQTAIAPGYLEREWEEGGRRYYHYKMDAPILNFYAFVSAKYEKHEVDYQGVKMGVYYHKSHAYNVERMRSALTHSLDYYQAHFSPYQFRQIRIVEFPRTHGMFAQAFANTVPFSEAIGFIAQVDDEDHDAVDYPYAVTAHEFAHQWWAHQVIGAYAQGSTMLSESLSEYSSLKVLEQRYGKGQMTRFLRDALNSYLMGRASERIREMPLMYNENQSYIHYNKGSLVMYTLSELMGEENFNAFLAEYLQKNAFQNPPYTTSMAFVDDLQAVLPDSLDYLITDLFRRVTLYDNRVDEVKLTSRDSNQFVLDVNFTVRKFHNDPQGKRIYKDDQGHTLVSQADDGRKTYSLPLADYIDIAVVGEDDHEPFLYKERLRIHEMNNRLQIPLDRKPTAVIVDPYSMLLDAAPDDNRKRIP